MRFIADALNLTKSAARRLEERNILRPAVIKHPFFSDIDKAYCLVKKFGEYEEGTLIAETKDDRSHIVRGYPKIKRALTLYPTIKNHFNSEIIIEEKMNGYNVRLAKFGSQLYAITRRGYICPYTTEKAREKIDIEFFNKNPAYILCCEAVGEESPFVSKDIYGIKGIEFFVFDIRVAKTNEPLSVEEKIKISKEMGFNIAPVLTKQDSSKAHKDIKRIILEIGEKGREGIVIKDPQMKITPLKYTSSQSNCSDLRFAFRYFNEYSKDFMLSRIIREAFQSFEFNESEDKLRERSLRLGEAILKPIIESVKEVNDGKRVVEKHRLRFKYKEVLELFKEHLKRMGVDATYYESYSEQTDGLSEKEGGKYILNFERQMKSTSDKTLSLIKGNVW